MRTIFAMIAAAFDVLKQNRRQKEPSLTACTILGGNTGETTVYGPIPSIYEIGGYRIPVYKGTNGELGIKIQDIPEEAMDAVMAAASEYHWHLMFGF